MWVRLAISLLAANASAPSYAPVMPFLQFCRDGFQSFQTAFTDFGKRVLQGFVVFVKVQTDNVDGLRPRQVTDISTPLTKGRPRVTASARASGQSAGVVVVGQERAGCKPF